MVRWLVVSTVETMGLALDIFLLFDTALIALMFSSSLYKIHYRFVLIMDRMYYCECPRSLVIQKFYALLKILGVGIFISHQMLVGH